LDSLDPPQAEIAAAAPDHHVYIQLLYSNVLLDPGGADALGMTGNAELAARLAIERDRNGKPTGWLSGDNRASAAEMLGLSRQSLYVKLRRYGLGDLGAEPGDQL
jgi:hypothetical protein